MIQFIFYYRGALYSDWHYAKYLELLAKKREGLQYYIQSKSISYYIMR